MAASQQPNYPPELNSEETEYLISAIKDWSIVNGLAVRPATTLIKPEADPNGILATTAPVTLFPSPLPKSCFDEALAIQKAYNELYSAIVQDEDWLKGVIEE